MSYYSMPFIANIHHFLKVCLEVCELEYNSKCKVEKILIGVNSDLETVGLIKDQHKSAIKKLMKASKILLQYIYQRSDIENYYFFDCPFKVYENHYEKRKRIYLNLNKDATERDFIKTELRHLAHPKTKKEITFNYSCVNEYLGKNGMELIDFDILKNASYTNNTFISFGEKNATINYSGLAGDHDSWKFTSDQKIEFLKTRLKQLKKKNDLNPIPEVSIPNQNQLSVNQIIIFLDQLGVFTHPIFENISKNKQAEAISQIVGRNSKNVKIAIEKLDKAPSEIGQGFSKDFAKIQELISKLE